jgi:5-oxopent-3-ene-1,2,5-tricarboxylate decarboxylase/2-hydroxyhepta-2,4-diene-1,7-dioate isomerase
MWTEVELGIVISSECENIREEDAEKHIEGYTVCADITCENLNNRDHHLAFSKSRKNFCPIVNEIVKLSFASLSNLTMITKINGKITQQGNMRDIKYNAYRSISYISSLTVLKKGDLILLGTPKGVENNLLLPGDHVCQIIEDVGVLEYKII